MRQATPLALDHSLRDRCHMNRSVNESSSMLLLHTVDTLRYEEL